MVFLFQQPGLSHTGIKGIEWAEEGLGKMLPTKHTKKQYVLQYPVQYQATGARIPIFPIKGCRLLKI